MLVGVMRQSGVEAHSCRIVLIGRGFAGLLLGVHDVEMMAIVWRNFQMRTESHSRLVEATHARECRPMCAYEQDWEGGVMLPLQIEDELAVAAEVVTGDV